MNSPPTHHHTHTHTHQREQHYMIHLVVVLDFAYLISFYSCYYCFVFYLLAIFFPRFVIPSLSRAHTHNLISL